MSGLEKKSKFLVTGGAGFIGSHIVERLLRGGHFVRVLDNFSSGKEENLKFTNNYERGTKNYELIKGDICNFKTCQEACSEIDFVLHQAALRSVPKSLRNPYEYNRTNIDGTLNLLRAAKEAGVARFILASSSSIYGDRSNFPEKESDLPVLISPYALSKLAGEYYCRVWSEIYGLETVALRYFNVFGPRQSLDDEYAVVIPKFITCMLKDEPPPIFGDGTQSRDFTYVENVVEANILAATKPDLKCEVLNVACARAITVLELLKKINQILGKDIKAKFLAKRPGDAYKTLADISKISEILGFQPRIDFVEGLRKTIDYWRTIV
ncbi:MAG: SDR family oxidoreductase [Candidatus Omnitrophica bacterium]|nr:SDR family oxidoreductase [Candidatus Omnitrophota bacterium]